MKKALVLFALLSISLAAQAQKVTSASLQGTWALASVNDGEVILYPEERRGVFTDEIRKELAGQGYSEDEIKEEEASLAYEAADYIDTHITFTGSNTRTTAEGEETYNGTFTLNAEGSVITITSEGETEEMQVSFKEKTLRIYDPSDATEYFFNKLN